MPRFVPIWLITFSRLVKQKGNMKQLIRKWWKQLCLGLAAVAKLEQANKKLRLIIAATLLLGSTAVAGTYGNYGNVTGDIAAGYSPPQGSGSGWNAWSSVWNGMWNLDVWIKAWEMHEAGHPVFEKKAAPTATQPQQAQQPSSDARR